MQLDGLFEDVQHQSLDIQLENLYCRGLYESANFRHHDMSKIRGRNMSAEFYETDDGDYLSFVSDGSRTEAVSFNRREVNSAEPISSSDKRRLISENGAKQIKSRQKIAKIVKIALVVIGLGLLSGGVIYLFGPMMLTVAGILWNVISFVGGILGTVGSAIGSGASSVFGGLVGIFGGGGGGGAFAAALSSALSSLAIAGASITGGMITLQVASNIEDN